MSRIYRETEGTQEDKYKKEKDYLIGKYETLKSLNKHEDERTSVFSVGPARAAGSSGDNAPPTGYDPMSDPKVQNTIKKLQNKVDNQQAHISNL